MDPVRCTPRLVVCVVPPAKRQRSDPQHTPVRAESSTSSRNRNDNTADTAEYRKQRLFSPHRVALVDCDIMTRGLAPHARSSTVFHELFAEIVLVETSGVPVTELLVKDASCARLVRVVHWSAVPPPSFLIAGTVFHFVGVCDRYVPSSRAEPLFICHWMALASLLLSSNATINIKLRV